MRSLEFFEAYEALPQDIRSKSSPTTLFQMFALFEHKVAFMDRKSFGRIGAEGQHFIRPIKRSRSGSSGGGC